MSSVGYNFVEFLYSFLVWLLDSDVHIR